MKKTRPTPATVAQQLTRLRNDIAFLDEDRLLLREQVALMQRALEEMAFALLNRAPKKGKYTHGTH